MKPLNPQTKRYAPSAHRDAAGCLPRPRPTVATTAQPRSLSPSTGNQGCSGSCVHSPLPSSPVAALLATTAADAKVVITIDKSTQRMTVSVDGATRWTWPVSTGRRGHATPAGSFQAFRMEADHYSKEWDDAPMPHSIFFTKRGHAIHGSFDTRRLGTPASAGCVRLHPDNAKQLFALVKEQGVLNTTVVIAGEEPRVSAPAVATAKSELHLSRTAAPSCRRNRGRCGARRNTTTMMTSIRARCRRAIASRRIASPDIRRATIRRRRPATTTRRSRPRRGIYYR